LSTDYEVKKMSGIIDAKTLVTLQQLQIYALKQKSRILAGGEAIPEQDYPNDRSPAYAVGDTLRIVEVYIRDDTPAGSRLVNPAKLSVNPTGREHDMGTITYKLTSDNCPAAMLRPGYCVLGFGRSAKED
jgi:hypothetical protein